MNMHPTEKMKNRLKAKRTVVYDLQIIGEGTMNGLIHCLELTFRKAYPDVGNIDQENPEDGIFWGNVPVNLWGLFELLKEVKEA
jgi:hypothetical protein